MGTQKLPVQGTFVARYLDVPGQTGPAALTPFAVVAPADNRVTISRFKSGTVDSVVVTNGRAVVTIAAGHLNTRIGQQVTFSGGTTTGLMLNNQTWTIDKITSTTVYEFPCNIADGTLAGTIVQEPVFTLPFGWSQVSMDANANVEMCVDNTNESPTGHSVAGVATVQVTGTTGLSSWQIMYTGNSTPVRGFIFSDGFSTRIRCMGTTASSYFSVVA